MIAFEAESPIEKFIERTSAFNRAVCRADERVWMFQMHLERIV